MCHFSLIFLHCAFSNVSSNRLPEKMHSHIGCICLTFLHCVFSNVFSKLLHRRMQSHIGCIYLTFLHCVSSNVASNDCPRGCKITFIACDGLFSTVHFQMFPQIACNRRGIFTLAAFFLKYWHHLLFSSGFFLLHPLNQGHKFPFVPLPLCVVFCPNGCFKPSLNCNKVKFYFAYFHFLATHQQTIIKWWWSS